MTWLLAFSVLAGTCDSPNVTLGLKIESRTVQSTASEITLDLKGVDIHHDFDVIWIAGIRWDPAVLRLVGVDQPPEITFNPFFFYFLGPVEENGDPSNPGTAGIDFRLVPTFPVFYHPVEGEVVMANLRFVVLEPRETVVEITDHTPTASDGRWWFTMVFVCSDQRYFRPEDNRPLIPGVVRFEQPFVRGDADGNSIVDVRDALAVLVTLFSGREAITCDRAADADGSGRVNVADAVNVLLHVFRGGPSPVTPYPTPDFDADGRGCE
jgi:hypothetical protein